MFSKLVRLFSPHSKSRIQFFLRRASQFILFSIIEFNVLMLLFEQLLKMFNLDSGLIMGKMRLFVRGNMFQEKLWKKGFNCFTYNDKF